MNLDDICALTVEGVPIKALTAKNCALFIWGVWPRIFDLKPVIESWGFTYKTLAWEWVKLNRSGIGFHLGMGYYTRANPEPCLLAVKGSMPVSIRGERNLLVEYEDDCDPAIAGLPMAGLFPSGLSLPLISPVQKHSQKPDEQYSKIDRLYPDYKNRLELFARRPFPGWKSFGNQLPQGSDTIFISNHKGV
jgi:N6-adenosine-specific RNA methylase IME4